MEELKYKNMNVFALKGHKVKLKTYNAGRESEREFIKNNFNFEKIYTVDRTVVHHSSSEVYLKEFKDVSLNPVFFKDVNKQSSEDDVKHPDYKRIMLLYGQ